MAGGTGKVDPDHALIEAIPALVWRSGPGGEWVWAGPQWCTLTGQTTEQAVGRGWLNAVHVDDRPAARSAWRSAEPGKRFAASFRVQARDGTFRWVEANATPMIDADGRLTGWAGVAVDVEARVQALAEQTARNTMLQHRGRNTMMTIRAIARRTADNSHTLDDFIAHFDGRLGAYARSQSLATRGSQAGVDLETLIAEELMANQAREGPSVTIAGPPVWLPSRWSESLGLAIHELAANAVKFGALSVDEGSLSVRWERELRGDVAWLTLNWHETVPGPLPRVGGPGFGREMIERTLPYGIDAETQLTITPGGAQCRIAFPLPSESLTDE